MITVDGLDKKRQFLLEIIQRLAPHPESVTMVAVTKKRSVEEIVTLLKAGFTVIGENRVQEAIEKFPHLPACKRHLIGHLQSNKVRKAVTLFDCIQSVDSLELAQNIDRVCGEIGTQMSVFLEVNVANDPAKFGFLVEALKKNASALAALKNIRIDGLMTIGKLNASPEETRQYFRMLRALFDEMRRTTFQNLHHCSMGMSGDFQIALEEGATMIRIGSFLFQ